MRGRCTQRRRIAGRASRLHPAVWLGPWVSDRLAPLRLAATCLIATALIMRALVPAGWMPSVGAQPLSVLMPCPMMDGMRMPAPKPHPAKNQMAPVHEGSICPFATPPSLVRVAEPHRIEIVPVKIAVLAAPFSLFAPSWDHVPRAPPDRADATLI
jgi:hypothetical protein